MEYIYTTNFDHIDHIDYITDQYVVVSMKYKNVQSLCVYAVPSKTGSTVCYFVDCFQLIQYEK